MAKLTMPTKERDEEDVHPVNQKKPVSHRYWLQVDRQTKGSYEKLADAEAAAKKIKTAYPILQVGIYDAQTSQQTLI